MQTLTDVTATANYRRASLAPETGSSCLGERRRNISSALIPSNTSDFVTVPGILPIQRYTRVLPTSRLRFGRWWWWFGDGTLT